MMADEREYIEPVTIDRGEMSENSSAALDNESGDGVEQTVADERTLIAEKHAQKQRAAMGIEELTPVTTDPEMVSVKVNGKERLVPAAKVTEAGGLDVYQKRLAAEERLQEASVQRKQLEQQHSELQRKVAEFQNWQQQQVARLAQEKAALAQQSRTPQADPQSQEEAKTLAKRHIQALIDGEDDLAADLLLQLQARNTPRINVEEIEQRAVSRVQAMQRKQAWDAEHSAALNEFKERYSDVMANPRLVEVADQYTIQLQRDPNLTPRQILQAAGDYARQYRDEIAGSRGDSGSGRSEAKRAMSVARAATGRNPTPTARSTSPSDYIESLKASRGQL